MHRPRKIRLTIITVPLHVIVRHQASAEPHIVIPVETLRHTVHDSYGIFGVAFWTYTTYHLQTYREFLNIHPGYTQGSYQNLVAQPFLR